MEELLARDDGLRVTGAVYPGPSDTGAPWSQWGQGAVISDGRFFSAVGDHLGADGNSYLYEYDPESGELRMIGDALSLVDHQRGAWGFGKVHAQMIVGPCDHIYTSTYWGSRRGLEYQNGYDGDVLFRLDPTARTTSALGVPVEDHGTPSMAGSAASTVLFGEAVDPESSPDAGVLFSYDTATGESTILDDSPAHVGFRAMAIESDGAVLFSSPEGHLTRWSPSTGEMTELPDPIPGRFLRAATPPAPDGTIYGITNRPDNKFFALRPDGSIDELGEAPGYVASIAMEPDGSTVYFIPGAHGSAWTSGTPLMALDTATGSIDKIVELNPLTEDALGLTAGGTYNLVLDAERRRLFVGLNSAPVSTRDDSTFGEVVLLQIDLPGDGRTTGVSVESTASTEVAGLTCWAAPVSSAESTGEIRWEDVTAASGLDDALVGMMGHAAAWGDVDGDQLVDLVVGTFGDRPAEDYRQRGASVPNPDRLLGGTADGSWSDLALDAPIGRTSGALFTDLDLDGDLDLVLARNVSGSSPTPSQVWRNDDGQFVPVRNSGLDDESPGRSVGVIDVDRDGLHDLVILEDRFRGRSSRLYRNLGDMRFEPFRGAWWPDDVWGLGLATGDLDGDGLTDLVVGGSNRVFLGTGSGLEEVVGAIEPWELFGDEDDPAGVALGDVDGDGDLDVLIGQHFNSAAEGGEPVPVRLYENRSEPGDLELVDITTEAGLAGLSSKAPHVALVDLDNDGRVDVLTSGGLDNEVEPAVFMNQADADSPRFAPPSGLGDGQYWVSAPTADVDRDGRLDVLLVEWDPGLPSRLLLNRTPSGHFLDVAVAASLGGGPGTTVAAYRAGSVGEPDALIAFDEIGGAQGFGGGVEPVAHLGLGAATVVDVVITPPQGEAIVISDMPVDRRIRVPAGC
ncbi:MAG: VCBS repeat-containing protein [Actinomycetota bacterium]